MPILFQAFEAGHAAMATFHASGAEAAMRRLEARPLEIMAAQQSDLWFVMHVGAVPEGGRLRRRMLSLCETRLGGGGDVSLEPLASYAGGGVYDCAGRAGAMAGAGGRLAQAAAARGARDAAADLSARAAFLARLASGRRRGRPTAAQIMEESSEFAEAREAAG